MESSPRVAPKVIAHKGWSGRFPENTLIALREACMVGADFIEVDIMPTGDGQIVLCHDATVDRTTDGTGRIADMTLAQLKRLDAGTWFDPRFSGERIPTLEEALQVIEPTRTNICIEGKAGGSQAEVAAYVRSMLSLLARHEMTHRTVVTSFVPEFLMAVAAQNEAISRALDLDEELLEWPPTQVRDYIRAQGGNMGSFRARHTTPELLAPLNSEGIDMWVWTVNDAGEMRLCADMGVQGIMTDHPEQLKAVLAESEEQEGGRCASI